MDLSRNGHILVKSLHSKFALRKARSFRDEGPLLSAAAESLDRSIN
jgi:hypothetical protein